MRKTFLALCVVVGLPILAAAQTADQTADRPQTLAEQVIEEGLIQARPSKNTAIPEALKVYPVELRFDAVKDLPRDVSTRGVIIKGFSRYVEVDKKKIGQLVLSHLEKGDKTASLDAQVFTAQFDLTDSELKEDIPLAVKGDREALVAALKKLEQEEQEPEDAPKDEDRQAAPQEPAAVGGNAPRNDQAAQYKTPERLDRPKEPTEDSRITTDGCPVRVDFAKEQAIQQSKLQSFKDGVLAEDGDCSDSSQSYPLKKSYQLCKDKVDLEGGKVTAQFQWFYNDASQQYVKASECQPDPDKLYPITEKHGVCPIDINIDAGKATPKSKLVYLGLNGVENVVRDCAPSQEKPAVALTLDSASCPLKHDFGAGVSKQMGLYSYQLDGQLFQATPCLETEVEYSHHKLYKKNGNNICQPVVDIASASVTLQSRIEITVDGQKQYITECTPDEGGGLAIQGTTAGCEDPSTFKHDIAAGVSYGLKRFYYENPDKVYVTDCQVASDLIYKHEHKIEGWQNHDELKAAYPLTTVSIAPNGKPYVIAKAVVLPGETLLPYDFDHTENKVVTSSYEGCSVTHETVKVEIYKRPDKTLYEETIGAGDPIGPVNACKKVVKQPVWKSVGDTGKYLRTGGNTYTKTCSYYGKRVVGRDDGKPITQKSRTNHGVVVHSVVISNVPWARVDFVLPVDHDYYSSRWNWTLKAMGEGVPCPATWTGAEVYGWNHAEGW